MTNVFLVTSHGWSGSSWFANILNSHDDIFCSHLMHDRLPGKDDGEEKLEKNNLFDTVRQDSINRLTTPMNDALAKLGSQSNTAYKGNVGLYRARDLTVLIKKHGPLKHKITLVNLVRDPVSVVLSGYGQFQKRFKFDLHELHWNLGKLLNNHYEFITSIRNKYNLDLGKIQNLSFLSAAQTMASLRLDIDAVPYLKAMPNVEFLGVCQLEKLTADKEYFSELIEQLVPGLTVSEDFLNKSLGTGPINRHYKKGPVSALERFESLLAWQKETINYFWKLNDLQDYYCSLGYKFEYLHTIDQV
jgi:hypothetical protein